MYIFVYLQTEARIQQVIQEKNKDIADRDEKLTRLKKQIADTLKGNSWSATLSLLH